MAKKAGLGRGLDALFADAAPIIEDNSVLEESGITLPESGIAGEDVSMAGEASGSKAAGRTGKEVSPDASENAGTGNSKKAAKGSKSGQTKDSANVVSRDVSDTEDRVLYIDINDIKPGSAQPRIHFDEAKLEELAGSIKANGVIQPLIVRESTNGYELVAGERRWRASRIAGLDKVPCIIRDFDDRQNAIVAIIENMQREDLNPIEEARGLRAMTEKYGFTQEQVSSSLGRSRTYIANSIRLLKLPEEIQAYVSSGQMSAAHGRTIINISDKAKQREIADKIIRNDLSVRATEKLADKVKDELKPERKRRRKPQSEGAQASAEMQAVEAELKTLIGTKVLIKGSEENGRIELEYYSLDELNRLIEMLRDAFR